MRVWRLLGFGVVALCACNAVVGFSDLQTISSKKTRDGPAAIRVHCAAISEVEGGAGAR